MSWQGWDRMSRRRLILTALASWAVIALGTAIVVVAIVLFLVDFS